MTPGLRASNKKRWRVNTAIATPLQTRGALLKGRIAVLQMTGSYRFAWHLANKPKEFQMAHGNLEEKVEALDTLMSLDRGAARPFGAGPCDQGGRLFRCWGANACRLESTAQVTPVEPGTGRRRFIGREAVRSGPNRSSGRNEPRVG